MSGWGNQQQQRPTVPRPGLQVMGVQPDFTKTGKQRFMVQMSDGNAYSTFNPQHAAEAQSFVGAAPGQGPVGTLLVELNGQYENYGGFQPGVGGIQNTGAQFPAAQQQAPVFQNGGAPVFTPAPNFQDAKTVEIRRAVAIKSATEIVAAVAGTGVYLNDEGALDIVKVSADLFALTAVIGPYLANGPAQAEPVVASLPPGATQEQAAAWVNAEAGAPVVQVGAPVAAPAEAAPAAAAY